ncbi:nitroreductase family deazaflavin-dependent oxidoreductase [Nocardia brasiliensis]
MLEPDAAARTDAAAHWRAAAAEHPADLGDIRKTTTATWLLARLGGRLGGGRRVKLLELMGRGSGLFFAYAPLGLRLVPGSTLGRVDCELATLRTAWNVGARYIWHHHVYVSRLSGLSMATVERVTVGPDAPGWTDAQYLLLQAVDELHTDRMISDPVWTWLTYHYTDAQLVDLCMLVGHYEMLAMLLKSHGIEPEPLTWRRGPLRRLRDTERGDGIAPRGLARFNRVVTNRLVRVTAGKLPPYSMIHHVGRRSGRAFSTPVFGAYRDDLLLVPLFYGDRSDWVRNLLAAGGGRATYRRRTRELRAPRVVDTATATELPSLARIYARLVPVLVAEVTE